MTYPEAPIREDDEEEVGPLGDPSDLDAEPEEDFVHDDVDPVTGGYSVEGSIYGFPEEHENDMDDALDDRAAAIKAKKKLRPARGGFFGV
jgi:hypothetical protein